MDKCTCCGKLFKPQNSIHKYCSKQCKWKSSNDKRSSAKRKPRECPGCGKDISGEYANKKYCSNACRRWVANGNSEMRKLNTHCVRCGSEFLNLRAGKKYCSVTCKKMAGNDRNGPSYAERYQREREHRLAASKRYAQENPHVAQAAKRRRRAALSSNGEFRFSGKDWKRCMDRHGNRCAYCATKGPLTIDHVVPVCRGGTHGAGNIVPACARCNSSKRHRFIAEWKLGKTVSMSAA